MKRNYYIIFCLGCLVYAFFLSTSYSLIIWERIFFLEFIQFPWRFLMVTTLFLVILVVIVTSRLKKSFQSLIILMVLVLNIVIFYQFFQPIKFIKADYFNLPYSEWRNSEKTQEYAYFEPGYNLKGDNYNFNNSSIKSLSNSITIFSCIALIIFLLFPVKENT